MTMSCEQVYMVAAAAGAVANVTNTKRHIPLLGPQYAPVAIGVGVAAFCGQMGYTEMAYAAMAAYAGDFVAAKTGMKMY